MGQYQEYVEDLETESGHGEEVDGDQLLGMILTKVRQVCDGGLRERSIHLLTLLSPMSKPSLSSSPWCTPTGILPAHLADQFLQGAYHVSADGKKFLINSSEVGEESRPLTLVQNWTAELKK